MPIDPAQLLKRLEPPVRPGAAGGPRQVPRVPIEQQSFDQLLTLVTRGDVQSDRPVDLAFVPEEEITEEQMSRLAAAADLAQSRGARRAVMLIDGRGLLMNVQGRAVETELSAGEERVFQNVDAAVYVAGEEEGLDEAPRMPGAGVIPPAVAAQIEAARDSHNVPGGAELTRADSAGRSVA
ncbi:MAG: hypothetical protein JSV91_05485 [Phycisphaerales bacterium]|nr:MAG: hypothetical protein JSV91_05485 [Phycisphaerales bacterium]